MYTYIFRLPSIIVQLIIFTSTRQLKSVQLTYYLFIKYISLTEREMFCSPKIVCLNFQFYLSLYRKLLLSILSVKMCFSINNMVFLNTYNPQFTEKVTSLLFQYFIVSSLLLLSISLSTFASFLLSNCLVSIYTRHD